MKILFTILLAFASVCVTAQSYYQNILPFQLSKKTHTRATVSKPGHSENYTWNSAWDHTGSTDYTYDADGNEVLTLSFDPGGVLVYKVSNQYNAQGLQTEWMSVSYSGGDADSSRGVTYFDAQGNQTQYLNQQWISGAWVTQSGNQSVLTYDANDHLIEIISQQYDGGAWINSYRILYTVDVAGTISAMEQQLWNGSNWQNRLRYVNIVWQDQNNEQPASYTEQGFGTGSYIDTLKHTVTYGANGSLVHLMQAYNGSAWTDAARYIDSFDSHLNAVEFKSEIWESGAWVQTFGTNYINTYSGSDMTERIVQYWETNQYENSSRQVFSGFQYFTGTSPFAENNIAVFPNPTNGTLNISTTTSLNDIVEFTVTDCFGRVVLHSNEIANGNGASIDVSSLPYGYYMLNVTGATRRLHTNFLRLP